MGMLPVPAKTFFKDFACELLDYDVFCNTDKLGTFQGLYNSDEHGEYIGFLVSDNPKIEVGYTLATKDNLESYTGFRIEYDRFNGTAELMKVYF